MTTYVHLLVIARGLSLHKRPRLHFRRGSKEERANYMYGTRSGGSQVSFNSFGDWPMPRGRGMDSQPVIRAGNMDTTSNSEVIGVVLDITTNKERRK